MSKKNRNQTASQEDTDSFVQAVEETPVLTDDTTTTPVPTALLAAPATTEEIPEPIHTSEPKEEPAMPEQPATQPQQTEQAPKAPIVSRPPTPADTLNRYTTDYVNLIQPGIKDETVHRKAVELLGKIATLVLSARDDIVFDAFFGFMMKHRSLMLNPQSIVQDLVRYCDKTKITRIVQFYVIFQSLVESKLMRTRYTLNIKGIRELFNNEHLANWLLSRR